MERDRCRDLRPFFVGYVIGTASRHTQLRIEAHVQNVCAGCSVELEELNAAFHRVPLAEAPQPLGDGSVDLLVGNISARPQDQLEIPILYPETPERRLAWTLVILFGVALLAAGFWGRGFVKRVEHAESQASSDQAQVRRVVDEYRALQERAGRVDAQLNAISNPRITSHDFPPNTIGIRVRAFVDLPTSTVFVTALGFEPAPPGEVLALWWRAADGTWTFLGTVPTRIVDRGGAQSYALPEGAGLPATMAVTMELDSSPAGDQPMGRMVIEGELRPGEPWVAPDSPTPAPESP